MQQINEIVSRQREFFLSGATLPRELRLAALRALRLGVMRDEAKILAALKADLNKAELEGYMSEVGMVLDEVRFCINHLQKWMKPRRVPTPLAQFQAKSFVVAEPYGVALIMAPWNYPFQLCIEPLIGALAAGNCAVVKPSAYAPATSRAVAELIASIFPPEHVAVVEGGRQENAALLEQKFDYIFFTGSVNVGKLVMEKAARRLTPVSLELGGKSPVIVDATANVPLAAKRVAFGKALNAGQTCVAPDYAYVHKSVKKEFMQAYEAAMKDFFKNGYDDMARIVNDRHFERVRSLMQEETLVFGGDCDPKTRFIAPALMDNVSWESPVMGEEIFGPLLPVLEFQDLGQVIAQINARPKPLALYLFTTDHSVEERVLSRVSYGGGCINDVIIHLATPHMGFGGVGESGMGSYHGKSSFDTFTHYKSIVKKANWLDLPMRYMPYTKENFSMIRKFLK